VRPAEEGGFGLDALWNDDFHHGAMVALTGKAEAYYRDTHGEPQEFVSAAKYGTLFQGQYYHWQRDRRGTPAWGLPPDAFITFLQNHDQVANSARGLRGHLVSNPGRWRALTALLLLGPWTPMLFMGQEFAASTPFLYFADFDGDLGNAIRHGRAEFMRQFPSVAELDEQSQLAPPGDRATFEQCVLDFRERESHREAYALHLDLLRLRREEAAFNRQAHHGIDGSVLSASAFLLRFFTPGHTDDRLLIVNLGATLERDSIADPLLAPPLGTDWRVRWASEDLRYGGGGTPEPFPDGRWRIAPESALVLAPGPPRKRPPLPRLRRHG
jgi:maltooligosyltrehalose trehalohydrolase